MALSQPALLDRLDALSASDGVAVRMFRGPGDAPRARRGGGDRADWRRAS